MERRAKREVVRSNGEVVLLTLRGVIRDSSSNLPLFVTIDIEEYNAHFCFGKTLNGVELVLWKRKPIDPSKDSTLHVSRSVYADMVLWASAILSRRKTL